MKSRSRPELFFWMLAGIASVVMFAAAGDGNSFHDFLGGRFPVADGFDWLKASVDAASGYGTDYGVRRPWNLPFNVASLWAGDRIGPDPLLSSLAIKRLMALASVASLLAVLRPRLTLLATAGLGVLLVSTLPRLAPFALHQDFIGQGLGYTQGSELNAFIFVNMALAWLVLGAEALEAGRFRSLAIRSSAGVLLLTLAVQSRPGTLGLLPSLVVLLAAAAGRRTDETRPPRWSWRRAVPIVLVAAVAWALVSGGQLALAQALAKTSCGAIGGNAGSSVMGMATGQTWREALRETQAAGWPECGRELSRAQMRTGIARIRANPLPFLSLLKRNAINLASTPIMALVLVVLGVLALRQARVRTSDLSPPTMINAGDQLLVGVAICGSLSILLFQVIFLGEAGLRPSVPYSAFPFLLLILAADQSIRLFFPLLVPAYRRSRLGHAAVALMSTLIVAYMALGMLLIHRQALRSAGYDNVTGKIQTTPAWLHEWMRFQIISPTMKIMYEFQVSPDLVPLGSSTHEEHESLCVHYRRKGFPWGLPYGQLMVDRGPC